MCTRSRLLLVAAVGLLGCGRDAREPTATRTAALTSTVASDWDTFINSAFPDNNNGHSPSLFTGHNGQGGMMRALVGLRSLPREAQGRVTVNRVRLTLITRGTGLNEDIPPTPATLSLQALTIPWEEGVSIGNAMTMFTVGQPCNSNGNSTGATWNQPHCAGATDWAGGAVAAAVSGTADVPAALETAVTWDSASGNDGMAADVQRWIDDPNSNEGWRLASSTETNNFGAAQKFYSREEPGGKGPVLIVDYTCKPAFALAGNACTTCTPAAVAACAGGAPAENSCVDPGAPATTYQCFCTAAGYVNTGTACERVASPDASDADATDGGDGAAGAGGSGGGGTGGATGTGGSGGTGGTGGAAGTTGAAGTGGATGAAGSGGVGGAAAGAGGTTGGAGTTGTGGTTGGAGTTGTGGTTGGAGTTGTGGTTGGAGTTGTGGTTGGGGTGGAAGGATGTGGVGGTAAGGTGGATAGTSGGRGGTTGSAGSAAGRGGSSGAAGTTGRGGSAAAGTAGTTGNTDNSGCGCAVGARDGASRALGALLAVVGITLRKRRR